MEYCTGNPRKIMQKGKGDTVMSTKIFLHKNYMNKKNLFNKSLSGHMALPVFLKLNKSV